MRCAQDHGYKVRCMDWLAESSEPQALPPKAYKDSIVNLTPAAVPA